MTQALTHRGPDSSGVLPIAVGAMGHTRLSIIDLSAAGHQPMTSGDGRLTLVYNGEIYNFRELRQSLEQDGVAFRSSSDTEVVLYAYERWGMAAFERFNGMFALALWDARERELILARDRFGIKPLYYAQLGSRLVFGSEIKALLAAGDVPRRIDPAALHEYLYYGNALGERALFAGIRQLLPGHVARVSERGLRMSRFFSFATLPERGVSEAEAAGAVREHLANAVRRHLVSDVPIGVFLSGGIDSSAITALASRYHGPGLTTYSVGFDYERGVNELPKARAVAQRFGTDHHELRLTAGHVPAILDALVTAHDQPFGDAANIPLYLLCKNLAGSIKVILQGDGGDEIFAGYRRYNALSFEGVWRAASRALPLVARAPAHPMRDRLRRFLAAIGNPDSALQMAWLLTQEPMEPPPTRVLSREARAWIQGCDPFARYREVAGELHGRDAVQRMLYTDAAILLPDIFLQKVDRATMAFGIEVRVPFLDTELTEHAMALPSRLKVRALKKKRLLRRALRGIVPDDVLDGRKTGFGVPYGHWLRTSLSGHLREVLTDPAVVGSGLFDRDAVETCIDEHVAGVANHGFLLYKLLGLGLWHARYMRQPVAGSQPRSSAALNR